MLNRANELLEQGGNKAVQEWWETLTEEERRQFNEEFHEVLTNLIEAFTPVFEAIKDAVDTLLPELVKLGNILSESGTGSFQETGVMKVENGDGNISEFPYNPNDFKPVTPEKD